MKMNWWLSEDGWIALKGLNCKTGYGASLSKVPNGGFDNTLEDCKAGCKLKDGCEAFNFGPDAKCTNLKNIVLDKCEPNSKFDLYQHGMYWISSYM